MKLYLRWITLLTVLMLLSFSTTWALKDDPVSLEKAWSLWEKDKGVNGYIIGSFKMNHIKWDYIDKRLIEPEEINSYSRCTLRVNLLNTETGKTYNLPFKPMPGSTYPLYNAKHLRQNETDPYWVLEVPPGNYALSTVTFFIRINQPGYEPFDQTIVEVPLSRDIKREVTFKVQPKQLVYIGDYSTDFRVNVVIASDTVYVSRLFCYNVFKIGLNDDFENMKNSLFADNKDKNPLNSFNIVSALAE